MNKCCSSDKSSENHPKKYRCPVNGNEYPSVKLNTLMHHIKRPWEFNLVDQGYYFCDDPDCDVVYFGQDNSVFNRNQVRTIIWQKEPGQYHDVCYCFGASFKQTDENKNIRQFIREQTQKGYCT